MGCDVSGRLFYYYSFQWYVVVLFFYFCPKDPPTKSKYRKWWEIIMSKGDYNLNDVVIAASWDEPKRDVNFVDVVINGCGV